MRISIYSIKRSFHSLILFNSLVVEVVSEGSDLTRSSEVNRAHQLVAQSVHIPPPPKFCQLIRITTSRQHNLTTSCCADCKSHIEDGFCYWGSWRGKSSNTTASLPCTSIRKLFAATQHPNGHAAVADLGDTERLLYFAPGMLCIPRHSDQLRLTSPRQSTSTNLSPPKYDT